MHRRRFYSLRFALGLILICAGLAWLINTAVFRTRRENTAFACLSFFELNRADSGQRLYDLNTGFYATDQRPQPQPSYALAPTLTGDGRYRVEITQIEPGFHYRLRLVPVGAGAPAIPLSETLTTDLHVTVSPRGTRIAYWEAAADGLDSGGTLFVADIDANGTPHVRPFPLSTDLPGAWVWSPDGDTLLIYLRESSQVAVWRAGAGDIAHYPIDGALEGQYVLWWGDGGFSYLHTGPAGTILSAVYPDGRTAPDTPIIRHAIFGLQQDWSPDRAWVSLFYRAGDGTRHLVAMRPDGQRLTDFAAFTGDYVPVQVWWNPLQRGDRAFFHALLPIPDSDPNYSLWRISRFDPASGTETPILAGLQEIPRFNRDSGLARAAITLYEDGRQRVELRDLDGGNAVTLVESADDAGDPYWSPDGERVAVVWANGQGAARQVFLTTARADGSDLRTWADGYWDIRNLAWLSGDRLAYVTWGGPDQSADAPAFGAVIADLAQATHTPLTGDLPPVADIAHFLPGNRTNGLSFWWRTYGGQAGTDAYTPEGRRLYRYQVALDVPITFGGGMSFGAGGMLVQRGTPGLFPVGWRFDGTQIAAVKLPIPGAERLYLAAPDGSWSVLVRENLSGLGDPLWSPDGTRLAFTQSVGGNPVTLEVVTKDGVPLRRVDRFINYADLYWSRCD